MELRRFRVMGSGRWDEYPTLRSGSIDESVTRVPSADGSLNLLVSEYVGSTVHIIQSLEI